MGNLPLAKEAIKHNEEKIISISGAGKTVQLCGKRMKLVLPNIEMNLPQVYLCSPS